MRLRYESSISASPDPVVLLGGNNCRVELHLRQHGDATATLVALSGRDGQAPSGKAVQQGPYQSYDQAVAARRAIAGELLDDGFSLADDQQPLWSMTVQRLINQLRLDAAARSVDYRFKPEDVFLDW